MFRIKICGITRVEDAIHAENCGADAIGLNFCAASRRCLTPAAAEQIAGTVGPQMVRVGVFVNSTEEEIRSVAGATPLDMVQLHGDEPLELIERLQPLPVIRAVRWNDESVEQLRARYSTCGAVALLVDAYSASAYGGTGERVDWRRAAELVKALPMPLVLAGGLTADNVGEAIRTTACAAVDVASGVESSPGVKDRELVERFVAAAS